MSLPFLFKKLSQAFLVSLTLFATQGMASVINLPGQVLQIETYTSLGPGTIVDTMDYRAFDTSLGTLDRVSVSFNGVLTGELLDTTGNIVGYTSQGAAIYGPSSYLAQANFRISEVFNGGFDFASPAKQLFSGTTGTGIPGSETPFVTNYYLAFSFDDISDLLGFATPSSSSFAIPPLPGIYGTRADFTGTLFGGVIESLLQIDLAVTSTGTSSLLPITMSNVMTMELNYFYTPHTVPEPETLSLLALGLLGMMRIRNSS